jgi:hypothetical protein
VLIDLAGTMSEMVAELPRVEKLLRELFPGVEISGPIPAEALAQTIAERDVGEAEMFALPLAAVLTLLFFRSVVAALLPIAIGAFAMALSVAVIRCLANFLDISMFSLNVSAFLGLGSRSTTRCSPCSASARRWRSAPAPPRRSRARSTPRAARVRVGPHRDGEHGACCSSCRCRSCAASRWAGSSRSPTRWSARSCCCPRCSRGSGRA